YHGVFLVLERTGFGPAVERLWRPLRHGYALLVVMVGWVLFRAETFGQAMNFLGNLAGISSGTGLGQKVARYWSHELACSIACGAVFAMPVWGWICKGTRGLQRRLPEALRPVAQAVGMALQLFLVVALLLISASWLAGGTYNPFIYFRF
ncbi:MAG: MBOAT family protein, partial [Verrucomicrobiia bacterium]